MIVIIKPWLAFAAGPKRYPHQAENNSALPQHYPRECWLMRLFVFQFVVL